MPQVIALIKAPTNPVLTLPQLTPPPKTRLVLIDGGPIIKLLELRLEATPEAAEDYLPFFWEWLRTCAWMPMLADYPGRAAQNMVLLCLDSPPYWRTLHCREYKSGRSPKSDLYFKVLGSIPEDYPVLAQPGYEADDVIALACREFRDRAPTSALQQAFILTVDHDLMGLITEEVTWMGAVDHGTCRVRNPFECYEWLANRYPRERKQRQYLWPLPSREAFRPTDIWQWKAIVAGDKSDGLSFPLGKDPCEELSSLYQGLIDLHNPLIPIDPLTKWALPALEKAQTWQPQYIPDDLVAAACSDTGIDFPIKPIGMVPTDLIQVQRERMALFSMA